jgi:uncharacterized protein with HEPN domain
MQREPRAFLEDMHQACLHVQQMTDTVSFEGYVADEQLRWATERQLMILGEALYQLHQYFPEEADDIPNAARIIRFRHVLVHGYAKVQHETIWTIIKTNVPELANALEQLLKP